MDSNTQSLIDTFAYQLIEHVSEFKNLQFAIADLDNNIESKQLLNEINTRKETISVLQSQSLPVSKEQADELAILMARMREDNIIMNHLRCKNLARKKAIEICNQIESIIGADFSSGKVCK